jgi:uroporphyrinogen decarboxylase
MTRLKNCLLKKDSSCVPVWFMRQAGRYLPEFREIRSKNKNFIKLCLNSNLSSVITLQPLKRFNVDAAIIFSDILIVPFALGQNVVFAKEKGPSLSLFNLQSFLNNDKEGFTKKLDAIYEAIKLTRKNLNKNKSLISFIGAPWTLIVYMFGLKVKKNQVDFKKLKSVESEIKIVINIIVEFLCLHLLNQFKAGSDVVQIFDSWAGLIPEEKLFDYCFEPNRKIVEFCKKNNIPVICFPKGIKTNYLDFAEKVNPDCLNLDYEIDLNWAKNNLNKFCLQGGMDPKFLFKEEAEVFKEVDKHLNMFKDQAYIFNLGHGLLPETSPDVLKKVVERVNNYK